MPTNNKQLGPPGQKKVAEGLRFFVDRHLPIDKKQSQRTLRLECRPRGTGQAGGVFLNKYLALRPDVLLLNRQ